MYLVTQEFNTVLLYWCDFMDLYVDSGLALPRKLCAAC